MCLKVETDILNLPIMREWNSKYNGYVQMYILSSVFAFLLFQDSVALSKLQITCEQVHLCMCNITYPIQIEYCNEWLHKTNNGTLVGLNSTNY